MIYLTGSNGLVGSRLSMCLGDLKVTKISYRDNVSDIFESHEQSCLIHLGWSSNTRIKERTTDVINSKKLFQFYQRKNPNGKIIFLSSAGDLHRDNTGQNPKPHTLYGKSKLEVEQLLENVNCKTIVLRVTNIWGGIVDKSRVNGLVDKLLTLLDTDEVVEIYANLKTVVDIIHVDDITRLILKIIRKKSCNKHETFLVGAQNISIYDIIDRVSMRGTLNLKINQKAERSYLNIDSTRVKQFYDWEPKLLLG